MSKQNGNKGRRFDRAFKEEAVRLLQTSGRRQRQIAGDLGISVSLPQTSHLHRETPLRQYPALTGPGFMPDFSILTSNNCPRLAPETTERSHA